MTKKADLFDREFTWLYGTVLRCGAGALEEVCRLIFSLSGTGVAPARLGLIEIKDSSGLTASDVAELNGHKEIAELLREEQLRMECFE